MKTESGSNISGQDRRLSEPLSVDHDLNSAGRKTETIPECVFVNCLSSTGRSLFIQRQVSCWQTSCSLTWLRQTGESQGKDSIKIVVLQESGTVSLRSS